MNKSFHAEVLPADGPLSLGAVYKRSDLHKRFHGNRNAGIVPSRRELRSVDERLRGSSFQRVHRNALVNVDHVRKMSPLTSQRGLLTLSNGLEFIVSKRLAGDVRQMLQW